MVTAGIVLLLVALLLRNVEAAVSCETSQTCEELLYPGSECSDGFCTNPYTKGGCLANRVPGWKKIRICNSDDPPNASSMGYCREADPGLEYTEIRLASSNWESAFFSAWIQQIILSELLNVPTSLESGDPDKKISFYDEQNSVDYGATYPFDGLETAKQVQDCRSVRNNHHNGGNYTQCCHVISEVWQNRRDTVKELQDNDIIERFDFLGVFGKEGWYIPRFTGQRDPSLLSYLGLRGEENRRKLAESFLTPTTWQDYCNEVSPDNCTVPNNISARAPADDNEARMYFSEGYTGHFRKTDNNNCDANPSTCHGHFADYPCGWNGSFQAQAFHNKIALNTSGDQPFGSGHSYSQMIEIWNAANATKSNVVMHWWQPEALYQLYSGTDAAFQEVHLPSASLECLRSQSDFDSIRCTGDFAAEQGDVRGGCDDPDQGLMKLTSTALWKEFTDPSIPEARRSPAYEAVHEYYVDAMELDEIFELWFSRSVDRYGFDLRNATCEWVARNLEHLQSFVPPTYPRAIRDEIKSAPLNYAALALGIVAVLLVCLSFALAYKKRRNTRVRYAQLDFLLLLLAGQLLVSIASIISAVSDTDAECVAIKWLFNLGYTLELVPLIIKVFAINRMMQAAKHFKRVKLKRTNLFGGVVSLTVVMVVFMIIWTVIDPAQIQSQYLLTNDTNDDGETIVSVSYFCRAGSPVWGYICLGVQGLLLFVASVLAFQMRNMRHEFNESQSLAILIYSQFIFWVMRLVTFIWIENSEFAWAVPGVISLLLALDTITAFCIYFLPKFYGSETSEVTTSTRARLRDNNDDLRITVGDGRESGGTHSEYSNGAHDHLNKNERVPPPLHGADSVRDGRECPHCGLPHCGKAMVEPADETAPLNNDDGHESCNDQGFIRPG